MVPRALWSCGTSGLRRPSRKRLSAGTRSVGSNPTGSSDYQVCSCSNKLVGVTELDHVDGDTKVANISEITNLSLPRFLAEVDKCQLLCGPGGCHR